MRLPLVIMFRAASVLCLSLFAAVSSASIITEFRLPATGNVSPSVITAGSDGNVWYGVKDSPIVVRVTPAGVMDDFAISETPRALTAGLSGDVWYLGSFAIGRLSPDGSVTTFPAPVNQYSDGGDILYGPDGNLWVVGQCVNNIYRVTQLGQVRAFPVSSGSCPDRLALGPDGNIWATLHYGHKIARITPAGVVTEFATPQIYPDDIVAGADGKLYFSNNDGYLGKITTSGVVTTYSLATGHFSEIALGSDGNLWLTSRFEYGPSIIRATPAGNKTEFALPNEARPYGLARGADGRIWFTDAPRQLIGAVTTTGTITSYPAAILRPDPTALTLAADGNVWFTEPGHNRIGRITPEGAVTEWDIPEPSSAPGSIVQGPDGAIWFTQIDGGKIGRATAAGITEFPIPNAYGRPTGITRGNDGNLWFTLAADDKVARMTPAGVVTEFPILYTNRNLGQIVATSPGTLWMTTSNGIARMSMSGTGYQEFTDSWMPQQFSSIAEAPDGTIWFAGSNGVGRISADGTGLHRVSQLQTKTIAAGPDGAMWATGLGDGDVRRFSLDETVLSIAVPGGNYPGGITAGSDGNVWFSQPTSGRVSRIYADLPIGAAPSAVCADGLDVAGIMATFTDSDPEGTAAEFTAEVEWSDGAITPGLVTASGDHFTVSGSHTFAAPGAFAAEVTIVGAPTSRDAGGSSATVATVIHQVEISAPATVCASTPATATVSVNAAATAYAWTISNGAILDGQGTNAIRFKPTGAGNVQLTVAATAGTCEVTNAIAVMAQACFRGDANGDGEVSSADAFFLIHHLFGGGAAPDSDGDVNSDGKIDVDDLTFLTEYLLGDGPAPLP